MWNLADELGSLHGWIHLAVLAMEGLAVFVIVVGIVYAAAQFAIGLQRRGSLQTAYHTFKVFMGRTLLLGLELLVAADVVYTVTLESTFESVTVLGVLVLLRTFLSWSLVVEIEGRWPWQPERTG
jgi:uncharacterized membrane protein